MKLMHVHVLFQRRYDTTRFSRSDRMFLNGGDRNENENVDVMKVEMLMLLESRLSSPG